MTGRAAEARGRLGFRGRYGSSIWRRRWERDWQFFDQLQARSAHQLRDRRGIQAGGVVLHQQRARLPVKRQVPDTVDLARVAKREDLRFAGLAGIAKENFHRRHSWMIPTSGPEVRIQSVLRKRSISGSFQFVAPMNRRRTRPSRSMMKVSGQPVMAYLFPAVCCGSRTVIKSI